jgi:hypothetical protein
MTPSFFSALALRMSAVVATLRKSLGLEARKASYFLMVSAVSAKDLPTETVTFQAATPEAWPSAMPASLNSGPSLARSLP